MDPDKALEHTLADHRAGRLAEAIAGYEGILATAPDHAGAWLNLGAARRQMGETAAALDALRRAEALAPDHPGVLLNLGNALASDGQLVVAAAKFRAALAADPDFADAANNLGDVLMRDGDDASARTVLADALARAPGHVGLMTNLANAEHRAGDTAAALARLAEAARRAPDNAEVLRNQANVLRTSGDLDGAETVLTRVLSTDPDDAAAHCLLAFCRLAAGEFGAGWDAYAWRWRAGDHEPARSFDAPEWDGGDIAGKSLLVWGEQAVGDELMFATQYADLAARGARITVETEFRLQPLFARSFPNFRVVERRDPPAPLLTGSSFDMQIAAGDLGRLLRRRPADFAGKQPYLVPDPDRTEALRADYAARAGGRLRVGLSWRSGAEQPGLRRSIPPADLAPLLGCDDVWIVNLQYGETAADQDAMETETGVRPFTDPGIDPLADLDGAAAQMAALDAVVSAANTTVHMAGALDLPTWVLLAEVPDWRWMAGGERSPWYPSLRLVRPEGDAGWRGQVGRAVDQIMLRSRSADR